MVTTGTYDHLGEVTSTADGYGNTTRYSYDYAGRISQVFNPDNTSADYAYDGAGDLTKITDDGYVAPPQTPPVLRTESFSYDADGNQTSAKDWNGNTASSAYNAAGELTSQTQPISTSSSITTGYGYDPAGNRTAVTNGNRNATWTTYNTWNLPESVIEPATAVAAAASARTWTTSYNVIGKAASVTEPGGVSQSYSYDPLQNLTSESGSGAQAATTTQSFSYDLDGRLTSATAPGGSDSFGYKPTGELASTSGPSGTSSFDYNTDGQMTSRTDAAGTTTYTYDNAARLATVADPLTGATLTYGYNADSQPTSIAYATGGTAGPTVGLGYNQLQQLTSQSLTSASGAAIASATYGYDSNGNLNSQSTAGFAGAGSTSYGYDQANRLVSASSGATTTNYAYDADGNLTQASGTSNSYNAQDQLTSSANSAGTTSYAYTPAGALSSVTPPSGSAQTYTSNAFGQTVTASGGISYAYDGLGRLASRVTSTTSTASFFYSGIANSLASDGTYSYSYDSAGNPVGAQASGGTAQSLLTNVHGDVTGTFSPAASTASLAASAAYSPYGTVTATSGTMPSLGYQGGYTDPATGQVNMAARWYSPSTGGFTSNDTISGMPLPITADGNPYAYGGGNPLTNEDPTGHCWLGFCNVVNWAKDAWHAINTAWDWLWNAFPDPNQCLLLCGSPSPNNGNPPGPSHNLTCPSYAPCSSNGTGPPSGSGGSGGGYVAGPPPPPQDPYAVNPRQPVPPRPVLRPSYARPTAVTSPSQLSRHTPWVVSVAPAASEKAIRGLSEASGGGTEPAGMAATPGTSVTGPVSSVGQAGVTGDTPGTANPNPGILGQVGIGARSAVCSLSLGVAGCSSGPRYSSPVATGIDILLQLLPALLTDGGALIDEAAAETAAMSGEEAAAIAAADAGKTAATITEGGAAASGDAAGVAGADSGASTGASVTTPGTTTAVAPDAGAGNIVYRALNSQDVATTARGEGIMAKNPQGAWSLARHLVKGSSPTSWANDPWISTTWDQSVARGFNEAGSKLGVVAINLDRVSSVTAEGWRIFPRLPGEAGLPYYYSIWQQEVSVFQRIPQEAIMGFVK